MLDFLVLDLVHHEQPVPEELRPRLHTLVEQGTIEMVGRGRGARYILSRQFYGFLGKKGVYTRKRGLDRETNKALLLKHITDSSTVGNGLSELLQVLPALSHSQVQKLLRELKDEGRIFSTGRTRAGRWYAGRPSRSIAPKRKSAQ